MFVYMAGIRAESLHIKNWHFSGKPQHMFVEPLTLHHQREQVIFDTPGTLANPCGNRPGKKNMKLTENGPTVFTAQQ